MFYPAARTFCTDSSLTTIIFLTLSTQYTLSSVDTAAYMNKKLQAEKVKLFYWCGSETTESLVELYALSFM